MLFVSYIRRTTKILNLKKGSSKKYPMSAASMSRKHRVIILLERACLHNRIGRN